MFRKTWSCASGAMCSLLEAINLSLVRSWMADNETSRFLEIMTLVERELPSDKTEKNSEQR